MPDARVMQSTANLDQVERQTLRRLISHVQLTSVGISLVKGTNNMQSTINKIFAAALAAALATTVTSSAMADGKWARNHPRRD